MNIEIQQRFTVDTCRNNPRKIFVFGDNLIRSGTAGQAVIRGEPNAFGIPTKRYPATQSYSYFSDKACEREHVLRHLRNLYSLGRSHIIVFPRAGIGTGLAEMPTRSPLIYAEMCEILLKHFNFNNGETK